MNKILLTLTFLCTLVVVNYAQTTIAGWTFPTGSSADAVADQGISSPFTKTFSSNGTSAIDFSKKGNSTKSAQATGWDAGKDVKYWQIMFTTKNYKNILLSSAQQSGGNNPGPRDFKVQYSVGFTSNWIDVENSKIKVVNDWTTGVLTRLQLPSECNDKDTLYIRWIMTSDTSSAGAVVASNGISKIDDIFIEGTKISTGIKDFHSSVFLVFPNPTSGILTITAQKAEAIEVEIYDLLGNCIFSDFNFTSGKNIDLSGFEKGVYIVNVEKYFNQKLILK